MAFMCSVPQEMAKNSWRRALRGEPGRHRLRVWHRYRRSLAQDGHRRPPDGGADQDGPRTAVGHHGRIVLARNGRDDPLARDWIRSATGSGRRHDGAHREDALIRREIGVVAAQSRCFIHDMVLADNVDRARLRPRSPISSLKRTSAPICNLSKSASTMLLRWK